MKNEMKLQFLSESSNESFARVAVAAFVTKLDMTVEELSEIKTAVSEAVTNSIVHGYGKNEGYITVECKIDGFVIEITVSDSGHGISDIEKAREPLFTTQPEMERSGMGFTVMETFMDEVAVSSKLGLGTTVKMTKRIAENG